MSSYAFCGRKKKSLQNLVHRKNNKMLKKICLGILGVLLLALVGLFLLVNFSSPRPQLGFDDPYHTERSALQVKEYAVAAGTPWATDVAIEVLENGGNAVDAAVAGVLMLNVTFGEAAGFPGVAPVMMYDTKTQKVRSYVGAGTAPQKATIELFKERGHNKVPDFNILSQLIPASPDVLIRLLQDYGTKSFSELIQPAINRAREGFPVHHTMAKNLNLSLVERLGYSFLLPTAAEVYFDNKWWLPLQEKDHFKRPQLAHTFEELAKAEQQALANGADRKAALEAVRDYFYKGPIAEKIVELHRQKGGLITSEDLANYQSDWEEPLVGHFGAYTIYTNGTWTQGIVLPLALQLLEGIDLQAMGHNSADYVHTLAQAIDLTMADRQVYVGNSDDAPTNIILNKSFAETRRKAMTQTAFQQMPAFGKLDGISPRKMELPVKTVNLRTQENMLKAGDDTSQIVVTDKDGNTVAITPSDFPMSPMVPNTGLTMGIRMTQFSLNPDHANALAPSKRPRITPHAAMVFKNDEFYMAFNTPGGDMQAQALLQVFLNVVVFGMDIQTAINAPRMRSVNFPSSFDPEDYQAGILTLEQSLFQAVSTKLKGRKYHLKEYPDWDNKFSAVGAIIRENGGIKVGIDPRESGTARGK